MNIDRDQDEQFPRSGRTLIAIKMNIDRDLFEDLGDRDQGLVGSRSFRKFLLSDLGLIAIKGELIAIRCSSFGRF